MLKTIVTTSRRVNEFLEAKGRNSSNSKASYTSALEHLRNVLSEKYLNHDYDNVIDAIINKEVDVYEVLNNFVSYAINRKVSPKSIRAYVSALKSYFGYHDVDIIPNKFKRRVVLPTVNRIDEEPIDVSDIRKILLACSNRRLKVYLLILGSGGMRAVEALAIRNKDIDFSVSPTRIRIRAGYSKTRVERLVYISNECTLYLKQWLDWKYKNPNKPREYHGNDLVFTVYGTDTPENLYNKIWTEFRKLLTIVKMDGRKEEGLHKRGKITIHSLRRFVYTTICDATDQAYAEWFLGHSKSVYHTKKEAAKREIYENKIMKYLTFLDYSTLETTGKNIEAKLEEREKEITYLRERDLKHEMEMKAINERMAKLDGVLNKIDKLEKQIGVSS